LLEELPEVDLFLGTGEFHRIAELLGGSKASRFPQKQFIGQPLYLYDHRTPRLISSSPGSAYLKISEGCSNCCSYCVIPRVRGELRSRVISSVLKEAERAVSNGVKEINLVAQDITAYGKDRGKGTDLVALLKKLVRVERLRWIRLLYAHPAHLSQELVSLIRKEEKICKYLDLPLQHVDDRILAAMNRPVLAKEGRELLAWIREEVPGIALRTSLMVGFPGETERRFQKLLQFVKEAEFDHLGVFRYSKEEGTSAASLHGQISQRIKTRRYRRVMGLQKRISLRKQRARIGTRVLVLVERPGRSPDVLWEGRTQGQAPEVDGMTFLTKGKAQPGEMVEARITGATPYDLFGEILGPG
jgi:ribosomal protein S12 methylthiotransferase